MTFFPCNIKTQLGIKIYGPTYFGIVWRDTNPAPQVGRGVTEPLHHTATMAQVSKDREASLKVEQCTLGQISKVHLPTKDIIKISRQLFGQVSLNLALSTFRSRCGKTLLIKVQIQFRLGIGLAILVS